MELFEAQNMDKEAEKRLERVLIDFNKDAEDDGVLDIDIFFEEDEDE